MTFVDDLKWLLLLPVRAALGAARYLWWWVASIIGFGAPDRQRTAATHALDAIVSVLLLGAVLVFIPPPFNLLMVLFIGIALLARLRATNDAADRLWRIITLQRWLS